MGTQYFTGSGDGGRSLMGVCQLQKSGEIFGCLGALDELNAWLGFCCVSARAAGLKDVPVDAAGALRRMQELLFIAQAEVAAPALESTAERRVRILPEHARFLEELTYGVNQRVPPIKNFIVPGGSELAARIEIARSIARRAEREAVRLHAKQPLSDELLRFLNRLSSALFALARYVNCELGVEEEHPKYR